MSTPVTSPSARTVSKPATQKPRTHAFTRKTRIVRRRGRANNGIESDDEIEREVRTDSESDDDRSSSLDSATEDSDIEPASEDVLANEGSRLHVPSTKGVQSLGVGGEGGLNGNLEPFFAPTSSWSDMVADENVRGSANLPVIDFTHFDTIASIPPRQSQKISKLRDSSAPETSPSSSHAQIDGADDQANQSDHRTPSQTTLTSVPRRRSGQTARQVYQQRLETDPSYVPTVGGFWGHDDRLMEKDLRSLSGWWRGRWQGRGRGKGFGLRGGTRVDQGSQVNGEAGETNSADIAAVDRPWTHDGFEEMRRKEEQRRAVADQPHLQESQIVRGVGGFRGGRGGFAATRGRGTFGRGFAPSPTSTRGTSPSTPQRRVWFAMKPELMWSKQHEAFLFFENAFKSRGGHVSGYQVKLPGSEGYVARPSQLPQPNASPRTSRTVRSGYSRAEYQDGLYTARVCLPKQIQERACEAATLETGTPVEDSRVREETRPISVPDQVVLLPIPEDLSLSAALPTVQGVSQNSTASLVLPKPSVVHQLEQLSIEPHTSNPERQAKTEQAVLRQPISDTSLELNEVEVHPSGHRPNLPPLQTVFTPPPPPISQPSPVYGSPYTYPHALPLGIAMNHHGMPYEVTTGRPVYLQAPPMYNPQPLLHSHLTPPGLPYVAGHMHPSAVSPDFLSQPPSNTPPMNGFIDPSTGTPIFSFPRQTTRIEIRAPTEDHFKSSKMPTRGPSRLRTSATTFEPMRQSENAENSFYPTISTPSDGSALPYENTNGSTTDEGSQHIRPTMMAYPAYQQSYYYPEPYGYRQYVDMTQVGQYDLYNMDHQAPQGTVYY